MRSREEKKFKRLENKKRKIQAFLDVAHLNESDKKRRKTENGDTCNVTDDQTIRNDEASSLQNLEKNTFKQELDDYAKIKQKYRQERERSHNVPFFRLKRIGEDSLVSLPKKQRTPLFMSDIQALLTYCMAGDYSVYCAQRWCTLDKWKQLTNMVCIVVEGVGVSILEEEGETESSTSKWIKSKFEPLEVVSPSSYGSSVAEELAQVPTSNSQLEKLMRSYGSLESVMQQLDNKASVKAMFPMKFRPANEPTLSEKSTKLRLLLSAKQMLIEGYPLPIDQSDTNLSQFKLTKEIYQEVDENSMLISIDCEMCLTSEGSELTKICVINERMEVMYESYVKPDNVITNYLTRYSGVTEQDLEQVTTKLEDVQASLRDILPADCILVGQSLNFDLKALKMMHPYVIDTSVIFNITGERGHKTKLSTLTSIFLNRSIQNMEHNGHCPQEDAIAAMELTLLKIKNGYNFGNVLLGWKLFDSEEQRDEQISSCSIPTSEQESLQSTDLSTTRIKKKRQKTIGIAVSHNLLQAYQEFPQFADGATCFESGKEISEVLECGKQNATLHDLSITHLDLTHIQDKEQTMSQLHKVCKEMYNHTSLNGLFLMIADSGQKKENGFVALKLVKFPK